MLRWCLVGASALVLGAFATGAILLSGVFGSPGKTCGVAQEWDPSTDVLFLFFSEVGLAWPRDGLDPSGASTDAIQEFLASKDASGAATCIPVDRAVALLEEEHFPILFETKAGSFRLFTGSHRGPEGRRYYQYFSSRGAPRLVNASDARPDPFRNAWNLARKDRSSLAFDMAQSRLEVDRIYHNFGTVLPSSELETEFRITNIGDRPVSLVGRPSTSCGCTVAEFRGDRLILPGATVTLPVAVRAGAEGFGHQVTVRFADVPSARKPEALAFRLYASQVEAMEVSPGQLDFGAVASGEVVERRVRLSEVLTDRFVVTDVDVEELPIEHAFDSRNSQGDLRDWIITLSLCSAEEPGAHEGAVVIHTSSELMPDVAVPVSYTVASRVEVSPPMLVWDEIRLGEEVRPQEAILSCSGRDEPVRVTVKDASSDAPFDTQIEVSPEGVSVLVVTPNPRDAGPLNGLIRLSVESANWTEVVPVRCSALVIE